MARKKKSTKRKGLLGAKIGSVKKYTVWGR